MSKKLLLLSALLGVFVMFAPSCGEDSDACADVNCGNGTCFSGDCVCDDGYFNNDTDGTCTILVDGSYTVSEVCGAGDTYSSVVTFANDQISATNFWNSFSNPVKMDVNGNNITIQRQEPDNDDFFVQGSGTWSVNAQGKVVLTLSYKVTNEGVTPSQTDNCNATFLKN